MRERYRGEKTLHTKVTQEYFIIIGFHLRVFIYSFVFTPEYILGESISSLLLFEWKKLCQEKSNKKGLSIKFETAALT